MKRGLKRPVEIKWLGPVDGWKSIPDEEGTARTGIWG